MRFWFLLLMGMWIGSISRADYKTEFRVNFPIRVTSTSAENKATYYYYSNKEGLRTTRPHQSIIFILDAKEQSLDAYSIKVFSVPQRLFNLLTLFQVYNSETLIRTSRRDLKDPHLWIRGAQKTKLTKREFDAINESQSAEFFLKVDSKNTEKPALAYGIRFIQSSGKSAIEILLFDWAITPQANQGMAPPQNSPPFRSPPVPHN